VAPIEALELPSSLALATEALPEMTPPLPAVLAATVVAMPRALIVRSPVRF
jgi:hypothetical protein